MLWNQTLIMRTDFVEVIDNFLSQSYYESLRSSITSNNFPWYYNDDITYDKETYSTINGNPLVQSFGFSHTIMSNSNPTDSDITNLIMPMAFQIKDYLKASKILRIRLDMTMYNPEVKMHGPHVDYTNPHYSSVYYLNDSDGSTIIFNEKEGKKTLSIKEVIEPKPNRLLVFDGSYLHTGYSPSRHNCRVLINSNYEP